MLVRKKKKSGSTTFVVVDKISDKFQVLVLIVE